MRLRAHRRPLSGIPTRHVGAYPAQRAPESGQSVFVVADTGRIWNLRRPFHVDDAGGGLYPRAQGGLVSEVVRASPFATGGVRGPRTPGQARASGLPDSSRRARLTGPRRGRGAIQNLSATDGFPRGLSATPVLRVRTFHRGG